MIVTIHQPQYLPWLGYFDKIQQADVFVLLDDVQFKKNDWQNRNKIRTSQGWQWMTVPVNHNFGQKIFDVQINDQVKWGSRHLKSIEMNYCKAPFFSKYHGLLKEIYTREWQQLSDLNIYMIEEIVKILGITTQLVKSSEFKTSQDPTQRLIDLCQTLGADTYLAGADGKKYMDIDQFKNSGIQLAFQSYQHPVYPQLWSGTNNESFISHMAVIDLLFNCGPESLLRLDSATFSSNV